ncbi:MAG TPA: DUF3106 domain-containing protein [Verrucomicrobiae bacterium]
MSRACQTIVFLAAALVFSAHAQMPPLPPELAVSPTNLPPLPQLQSPVDFFRQLLAMTPVERVRSLTNRPPEARARILAKVHEYLMLPPDERELRLRATELRWWLTPLMQMSPTNRVERLAQVPEHLRGLVKARLEQWDILPPPLQQEFLANDAALHYFAHIETTNNAAETSEQQQIAAQFNQFFEFTPEEKQQTLNVLSDAERAEMERTLESFDKLPPEQKMTCLRNYAKFAGMSAAERAEFLKNAARWSQMSPSERQAWRDLVAYVPIWPTMPSPAVPPNLIPPMPPKLPPAGVATN